jgi:hypothetical protein
MTPPAPLPHDSGGPPQPQEGFVEIDGEGFYAIPDVDRLGPFLMSIISDSDHWMFVSSRGGLTAGRGDASSALFPYETDDRIHLAAGLTGPVTAIRSADHETAMIWRPFTASPSSRLVRHLYKSVVGNQVIFEEINHELGLGFRYRWAPSDRFGFVRTATLTNLADRTARVDLIDGLVNVLPSGLDPTLYQRMNNLTNAYKRSEVIDAQTRLSVFSLEAQIVDRPDPAEALVGSIAWSSGLAGAALTLDPRAIEAFVAGELAPPASLVTGRPGAYLLTATKAIAPGENETWQIVADVRQDQRRVAQLRSYLRATADPTMDMASSVHNGTARLVEMLAGSDALQRSGDRVATAHQFANVTYNVMRGGIFDTGYGVRGADFADFIATRNRAVADRHRDWLNGLPEATDRNDLLGEIEARRDPQLIRLGLEYLPLSFSRRHGDPSRPWNAFSIQIRDAAGDPVIRYEGNWRDIFQNWEALCHSFPDYLPSVATVFVDASTPDGFNPYRITRSGIDWEIPDPEDPWSNIGYWGDHQIVYLLRLLEATDRFLPGVIDDLLDKAWFSYADVPYRLASYDAIVRDPKSTIHYDAAAAARSTERLAEVGGDGYLVWDRDREVYLVPLLEKLLVPALTKLSNFVPGGGIWMNTQRPEWNDANNALVGYGLSMVTLYQLRRYLTWVGALSHRAGPSEVPLSTEVADWLASVTTVLRGNIEMIGHDLDPQRRKDIVDELGWAFFEYRSRVYASGFSGTTPVDASALAELCDVAVAWLDATIRDGRRPDGLYDSYNLIDFTPDGSAVRIKRLPEMLEGQVAVLSSGLLTATERLEVLNALFASEMYRADQRSFMLYPARRLPSFLDKNVVPDDAVARNGLFQSLIEAGDETIIATDVDGRYRFDAAFGNQSDLVAALDELAADADWEGPVAAFRAATLHTYEEVFQHHGYTGRSGSMYGYEGIGSIYWHMVAKLLVAVQDSVLDAADEDTPPDVVRGLIDAYWRVRAGLGFNKTAAEYGAFPTDPYSHTPAHAGAQQPGMTGQVKEELLTRPLELGVRVTGGEISFDPILLRRGEFLEQPEPWQVVGVDGSVTTIELAAGSLGLTVCQVPVVVTLTSGKAGIVVDYADGAERRIEGRGVDAATSRAVFDRTGSVVRITAFIPETAVTT